MCYYFSGQNIMYTPQKLVSIGNNNIVQGEVL